MSFRYKRIDDNQTEIVRGLRAVGASVQSIAPMGKGVPDLLVGYRGKNYLFEVKCHDCPPSKRKLTSDELKWQEAWRGQCYIIDTLDQALRVIGATSSNHVGVEHEPAGAR